MQRFSLSGVHQTRKKPRTSCRWMDFVKWQVCSALSKLLCFQLLILCSVSYFIPCPRQLQLLMNNRFSYITLQQPCLKRFDWLPQRRIHAFKFDVIDAILASQQRQCLHLKSDKKNSSNNIFKQFQCPETRLLQS